MAKFDPFLSLDCARVEGVGAQSKERKGSNFAAQRSGAIVQRPEGPNTYDTRNLAMAIWQPCLLEQSPTGALPQGVLESKVHPALPFLVIAQVVLLHDVPGFWISDILIFPHAFTYYRVSLQVSNLGWVDFVK